MQIGIESPLASREICHSIERADQGPGVTQLTPRPQKIIEHHRDTGAISSSYRHISRTSNHRVIRPVHPRACGEHAAFLALVRTLAGSSPQARGTRDCSTAISQLWTVHPRVRGEHSICSITPSDRPGSSPQARGTQIQAEWLHQCKRFIPAGAGNTASVRQENNRVTVHPRRRGEHFCAMAPRLKADGSSPQARGTRRPLKLEAAVKRFIPAGAGNTRSARFRRT